MTPRLLATLSLACAVQAQSISATAATQLGVSLSFGGVANNSTAPVGPLPTGPTSLNATAGNPPGPTADATLAYSLAAGPSLLMFQLEQRLQVEAAPMDTVSVDAAEILLGFQSPTFSTMTLFCELQVGVTAGTPAPRIEVDVGDDGTIDFTNPATSFQIGLALGGATLPVRVRFDAQVTGQGTINSLLQVGALPTGTGTVQLGSTCGGHSATPYPQFDGNVFLSVPPQQLSLDPVVLVLGLSTSPTLLGPGPGPIPCLLVPSPDAALFVPPNSFGLLLTIPAAARPVDVFAQTVTLIGPALLTGHSWWLQAY